MKRWISLPLANLGGLEGLPLLLVVVFFLGPAELSGRFFVLDSSVEKTPSSSPPVSWARARSLLWALLAAHVRAGHGFSAGELGRVPRAPKAKTTTKTASSARDVADDDDDGGGRQHRHFSLRVEYERGGVVSWRVPLVKMHEMKEVPPQRRGQEGGL